MPGLPSGLQAALQSAQANWVPVKSRKIVEVGGFIYSEGETLVKVVKDHLDGKAVRYEKVVPVGRFTDKVRIHFHDKDEMWKMLVAYRGARIECPSELLGIDKKGKQRTFPWHGIFKHGWEIGLSVQQQTAGNLVREALTKLQLDGDADVPNCVDTRSDYGDVVLKCSLLGTTVKTKFSYPIKLYDQDKTTHRLQVVSSAAAKLSTAGVALDLEGMLLQIHSSASVS